MPPPLETPLHLPSHPTSHRELLDLPALYSNFPLAVYFIHGNVYVSTLLSQSVPPSLSPASSMVCSPRLRFSSCSVNRFTIFPASIYMQGNCWSLSRVQLCDPMDCSSPGSSVHGILHARILEWVAISFSRGSSLPQSPA